jgi:hypothetical protein
MSLLDDASLLVTPNAEKATKLYSIIPTNGNGDFTVTRATTATRTNSSGLIESTPINEPRLDYSLGSCPNILLEPQRTNLATHSQEIDNVVWTKAPGCSVISNSSISPSGVQNADTIVGATGPFVFGGPNTLTRGISGLISSTSYVFTAYLKGSGAVTLTCRDGGTGFTNSVVCNLTSSWQRFEISRTTAAASTALAYVFSNASGNFDLWGAQLEAGAYATSYIPTTSSASVTRNADRFSRDNLFTNGLVSAAGGTLFLNFRIPFALRDNGNENIAINDSTSQNSLFIYGGSSGNTYYIGKFLSGVFSNIYSSVVSPANNIKIAIKWNGTSADIFQNGVKVLSSTAFTATTSLQFLRSNTAGVGSIININSMALFPTPLTDTQCIALTTL